MKKQTSWCLALALACLAAAARASPVSAADQRRVVALLKANPIVIAAVRQAQSFGGRNCRYEVQRAAAAPGMSDEVRDFEAEITCRKDEATGIVRVKGRLPGVAAGFEEVQVSVYFAG